MKKLIALLLLSLCSILPAKANVPCSVPFTLTNGTTADATQVMANYNALIACFTNAAAAGANSDITSLNALSTPIAPVAGGSSAFLATTNTGGTANAQTVATTTPTNFALTLNFRVYAKIGLTNTGPTTLTVASTATTNVFKIAPGGPVALTGGELQIGNVALFEFDGTQFVLLNPHILQGPYGPSASIASAATTDVASVGSHNVNITGTTTITNLGNTLAGQVSFPRYYLTLNGSQVNFNGTNCSTTGGCITTPGSVNFSTSSAGEQIIADYVGQGSNLGAGAGNWVIKSVPRSAQGDGRFATTPQVITATGTYTPTVGMLFAEVECIGGGGGGGGAGATANLGAGGGGGGGYTKGFFSAATIGASQSVTIGAAGTANSGAAGGNGGNTTFGALLTANGGTGAPQGVADNPSPGGGGTASGGYLNLQGAAGQLGVDGETNAFACGGTGGGGLYGTGGGLGKCGSTATSGNNATAFGAGGAGGFTAAATAVAGGTGFAGVCIVHEFIE